MTDTGDGYFVYHSIGQYSGKASALASAMAELSDSWGRPDDQQWDYLFGRRARFLELWRAIIGAAARTTTTCENVTQGLHTLMTSLPKNLLKGRRVLVAADCFPSNHFLLTGLQDRLGFKLDTVKPRQGAAWVADEDMIAQWDSDVAVALLTWVTSTTSHRADIAALTKHGKAWEVLSVLISRKLLGYCHFLLTRLLWISPCRPASNGCVDHRVPAFFMLSPI